MLVGKEVIHEYRGRGTIVALENGQVTVRFGADYDLQVPYPGEFRRMLRLREPDPQAQAEIDGAIRAQQCKRAEAYRRRKETGSHA